MVDEGEERKRLIRLYHDTGNENFLRAAECLNGDAELPLIWHLKKLPRGRGRPRTVPRDRIVRMGLMLARGEAANLHQASLREVESDPEHYRASRAAQLRREYRKDPPDGEVCVILMAEKHWRFVEKVKGEAAGFHRAAAFFAASHQALAASMLPMARMVEQIERQAAEWRHWTKISGIKSNDSEPSDARNLRRPQTKTCAGDDDDGDGSEAEPGGG